MDFEDSRDLLVDRELLEHQVHQVNRVSKVLQATPEGRVFLVTLERLAILAFRDLKDLMALRVQLDYRDLVVSPEPLARVVRKDELAVKDNQASEEIQDFPEELERLEILVCKS